MLDMKRLRLLWELSVRGTVAAVAEALNYSPSAVSQQLAILEREAAVPLLRRTGRTLELTAAARALVAETEALLAGLERAEAALHRGLPEVSGTIRVAVFQTAVLAIMPQALRRLRALHPHLRVEMVQHEPESALHETWARGFDLVVAEQYPGHAAAHFTGLDREPLTEDLIQLALPATGSGDAEFDRARTLADAALLPWVMEPRGAASRHWAEQACRSAGFEPDVRYETADLQAHVRLIESGNAVALLPGLVHVGSTLRLRLEALAGEPRRTIFTAARAAGGAHPALAAVREVLGEEARALG
ncbi:MULTISPECIES: LysR family transcriptional regulator [unclassified Leucobacter]|uniref:LysR family transcriptional regulator n=1 Tax=unclassified Leucobacter TaxID=2621730 RepID=UPI00165D36C7|nr:MULTISPECIES: LysR family transcriptional regulator [unclassified Leucobacter]MBC9926575.1 LysR family transcriptional regulator [Leucobacter sp. cx-169]